MDGSFRSLPVACAPLRIGVVAAAVLCGAAIGICSIIIPPVSLTSSAQQGQGRATGLAGLKARLENENDPYALHEIATQFHRLGIISQARKLWDKSAAMEPNLANADIKNVFMLLEQGNLQAAEVAIAKLAPEYAKDPHLKLAQSQMAMMQRDYATTERTLRQAVELGPKLLATNIALGRFLELKGDDEEAERLYRLSTELDPQRNDGWGLLASFYSRKGQVNESYEAAKKVEELHPRHPQAESTLAKLHMRRGDRLGAYWWFLDALKRSPGDPNYLVQVGQLEQSLKIGDHGRARFEQVLKQKEYPPALLTLAVLETENGNIQEATRLYRRTLSVDADNAVAANNLAMLLYQQGKSLNEALELVQRARTAFPQAPEIKSTYGCVLSDTGGDSAQAYEALVEALRANPADAWLRYALGKYLARQERWNEAAQQFQGCLVLEPDFPKKQYVNDVLKKLRTLKP